MGVELHEAVEVKKQLHKQINDKNEYIDVLKAEYEDLKEQKNEKIEKLEKKMMKRWSQVIELRSLIAKLQKQISDLKQNQESSSFL